MNTSGRYYHSNGRDWWLEPVPASGAWRCAVYALPCWPVSCHPTRAGIVVAHAPLRPSADLALVSGEALIRETGADAGTTA